MDGFPQEIVSGGQTGADRAALDWAIANGVPHGGWCPQGRRAEDGPMHDRYSLKETPSSSHTQRTEWNVRDSDGPVVFSVEPIWGHHYRHCRQQNTQTLFRMISLAFRRFLAKIPPNERQPEAICHSRKYGVRAPAGRVVSRCLFSTHQKGGLLSQAVERENYEIVKCDARSASTHAGAIHGVMGTFRLVWLMCKLDYLVRLGLFRLAHGQTADESSNAGQKGGSSAVFFKMLFLRLVMAVTFLLVASYVDKFAGATVGMIIFGPGLLLLAILNHNLKR